MYYIEVINYNSYYKSNLERMFKKIKIIINKSVSILGNFIYHLRCERISLNEFNSYKYKKCVNNMQERKAN